MTCSSWQTTESQKSPYKYKEHFSIKHKTTQVCAIYSIPARHSDPSKHFVESCQCPPQQDQSKLNIAESNFFTFFTAPLILIFKAQC